MSVQDQTTWDADGDSGLLPRSRATHTIARADAVLASRIVELRKQPEKDGPDAGAESIAARPEREGVGPPANSTIHRILVSAGPVRPEPGKRPKASYTSVFCQIFVGRFGVSFSPFERLFLGRFGFGQSCGLSVIA